jgi:hypothetical protein
MLIVNFSHPLAPDQIARIEILAGLLVEDIRDFLVDFDGALPLGPQAEALAGRASVSGADWQTRPVLVVLLGQSLIAAALLAVLLSAAGFALAVMALAGVADFFGTEAKTAIGMGQPAVQISHESAGCHLRAQMALRPAIFFDQRLTRGMALLLAPVISCFQSAISRFAAASRGGCGAGCGGR